MRRCVDCEPKRKPRPAPHPGPRCATHNRIVVRRREADAHARHVQGRYQVTPEQVEALWEAQGRACGWCGRALSGASTRRPSIDHDHACCPGVASCGKCVRGLLCAKCNRFLGYLGDDPVTVERGADYLRNPPARRVLGGAGG